MSKLRICAYSKCEEKFKPMRLGQIVCSPDCAYKYHSEKEIKHRHKALKKKVREESTTVFETLQDLINTIVRFIDKGHPDITGNRPYGAYRVAAGHLWSRGAHPKLRYNLLNIFAQDWNDNSYKGGMEAQYLVNLGETFGLEIKKEIEGLPLKYKDKPKLTKLEAKEKCKIAGQIIKELKQYEPMFSTEARIEVRRKLNERLGIYK